MDQENIQLSTKLKPGFPGLASFFLCLLVSVTATSGQLDDEFSSGLDALDNDRLKTAREIFHGILSDSPGLHRARLELARAYYMSLDYKQARAQAQHVLDDPNTPASVRTTVLAFVAQIDEDEKNRAVKHSWTPSIYLGLMHDTNVNVGPENQLLLPLGGLLNESAVERDDNAFVITPGISHTYNPGKRFELGEHSGYFLWQSQASYYHRAYFDEDDFNLGVLHAGTGPVWVVPRHWRAGIGISFDQIWLGGSPLALFSGINPNVTWQLNDNTEFSLNGLLSSRDYNESSNKPLEGNYRSLGASLGHYMNDKKFAVRVGGKLFDFDARGERFSHDGWEVFLGGVMQAWTNGSLFARAGYQTFDFDGQEPDFGFSREDDEHRYTVGFQHAFKAGTLNDWTLSGNFVRTDNESNVSIFDYDRDQYSLGLSRNF
ncbi:MAG: porin family protein [Gammaproteobacteria bacterium]